MRYTSNTANSSATNKVNTMQTTTLNTAQQTLMQTVCAVRNTVTQRELAVYEDGDAGVGMYASVATINTVYRTVLEQLGATDITGLAQLAAADGTMDLSVDFVYAGHNMYLTTVFDGED
jgi:hypothetical protein